MKRWIIFVHRYVGIPMSLLFVVWFLSGIVMMYTGDMPALSDSDRLLGRGTVDLGQVRVSPAAAAERTGMLERVTDAKLVNLMGRPAYRFSVFTLPVTVFADNGEMFAGATLEQGRAEAARFTGQPLEFVRFVETLTEPDQWTITQIPNLPLDRFDIADGAGTRAYFSRESGEVELITNRATRTLAWLGAIPHWFYFTALRSNQPVWYWTVVWAAVVGCGVALLGLVLAVTQFRRSKPFRLATSIRYRGLLRWHYLTGAVFGVFALTWVFSGMMSMEPFAWTRATGLYLPTDEIEGGRLDLGAYAPDDPRLRRALGAGAPYELELAVLQSRPYYIADFDSGADRRVVAADSMMVRTGNFDAASIVERIASSQDDAAILAADVLEDYDAYYYARGEAAPLPVLRVKFDDPARTWYYFDLKTSRAVATNHRFSRIERWLFNGLHSLDFQFWYDRRPLWDLGLIFLSVGALATTSIGMYLGLKRLSGRSRAAARASGR
jgi:hypothetical protein